MRFAMFSDEALNRSGEEIGKQAVDQATEDPISLAYLRTYHWIRTLVGILGLALPFILVFGVMVLDHPKVSELHSLSAYYHTGMRDFFTVILAVVGILLITYRISEKNLDNRLSWVAGAAAIGVAFFPTKSDTDDGAGATRIQGFFGEEQTFIIHLCCAGVFIVSLGCMSFLFAYREEKKARKIAKLPVVWRPTHRWAFFHLAVTIIIAAAAGFIVAMELIIDSPAGSRWHWWDINAPLIGESVVTGAFGLSWLAKGLDLVVLFHKRPLEVLKLQELKAFLGRFQARTTLLPALVSFFFVAGILAVFWWFGSPLLEDRMGGERVLDVMPWRGPDDVNSALQAYGASGRQWYLSYLVFDTVFAVLYGRLLAVSVAFAVRKLNFPRGFFGYLAIVIPVIGGLVFDLGENLLLGLQTDRFGHQSDDLSRIAAGLTLGKFAAIIGSLALSFIGLVVGGWRTVRNRPDGEQGSSPSSLETASAEPSTTVKSNLHG